MKESLPKHCSMSRFLNERRIRQMNATGVDQKPDCGYIGTALDQLHGLCEKLDINMNLFKPKGSKTFYVTLEAGKFFTFLLDDLYEKRRVYHCKPKQIPSEKWEILQRLLCDALQSCNVPGKEIKRQMNLLTQKRKVYVHNKNTQTRYRVRYVSRTEYRPTKLPAQYFRGTSLEMTPVVGNDPTLSEEEFRNAYELPISPLEI